MHEAFVVNRVEITNITNTLLYLANPERSSKSQWAGMICQVTCQVMADSPLERPPCQKTYIHSSSFFRGLSLLYSQTSGDTIDPKETQRNIREQLQWGPMWLLTPRRVMHYVKDITEKWKQGQPVSLTDFYGHCVGESLLGPVS